ncbi:hypothetical protein ACJ70E_15280 [Pseudomonas plecoglossicida]|uniref:hypothetical protein n=1 Tax=Pseudomonas plecoglossicida TaxID=70775 RepID=UPI00397793EA
MKRLLCSALLLFMGGSSFADVPAVNAVCPGNIEVRANEGGPVFINGKEAKLHKVSESFFEAKGSGVTVSVSVEPDGYVSVSYTGKGGVNGVCEVEEQD